MPLGSPELKSELQSTTDSVAIVNLILPNDTRLISMVNCEIPKLKWLILAQQT